MTLVVVDAENVRRSRWPNIGREELVGRVGEWAEENGHEPLIVFDGTAPEGAVGSGPQSADDWITRRAAELAERGEAFWLVTSDRELRRRAGGAAERTIGGGSFAAEL
jgi:hypothetical protein